jgi:tetratricopeptide (TPR) repeat protein
MSTATLTASEESQLAQTIEMFEVITQSQPHDYQSLEILKEAYAKLGRESDVVNTSKRIAQAYVAMGQLSSAILEYESILQNHPDDPDVLAALGEIESKANSLSIQPALGEATKPPDPSASGQTQILTKPQAKAAPGAKAAPAEFDDGRAAMQKIFVEGKFITNGDFELCWHKPDLTHAPDKVVEPFIQVLADKGILPVEKSLKLLCDKSRLAFLPLEKYDADIEFARTFPAATCLRWCVIPFDRMSKSILVATANPFNRQAALELEQVAKQRLLWYLAPPPDIVKALKKTFR